MAGRAVPAGSSTAYRPLTEALLQALRDRPFPDDEDLVPWLPALATIIPGQATGTGEASAAARGEAVLRLLRRLAQPSGMVVVLEDLHWADPDTLAVLEYLGDNLASVRVLCLATSRNEPPSAALEAIRRLHATGGDRRPAQRKHVTAGRRRGLRFLPDAPGGRPPPDRVAHTRPA